MIPTGATRVVVFVSPPEGVSILRSVLGKLPSDFPAAVLFLVHGGTGGERPLANNLNVSPRLLVMPGVAGTTIQHGRGYVVLPGQPVRLASDATLSAANIYEASTDPLLESLATHFGKDAVAVALTELTVAEANAFQLLRETGGHTIALNESNRLWADSSGPRVVPNVADELLTDEQIGPRLATVMSALGQG